MSEWKEIFIDSACSRLSSGKSISSSLIKDKGDYPVYGGNGIRGFTNTYNFDGECAIIGRQGASCGNVRYFSGKAYMTEHAVVAVPTKEHNAYYLSCVLASLKLGRLSGQSAQPGIGVGLIGKQNIIMPSLATQQKIASILSSLDAKIENNRKICANLEAQAQALFKHWFIDFAPFKDGKFVESELGMIPEGWRVGAAMDFFNINIGKTPPRQEPIWFSKNQNDVKWISISDLGKSGIFIMDSSEKLTKEAIKKHHIIVVPKNTILLSFKLTIGRVAICNSEMTTNEAIARFYLNDKSEMEYLYMYLKNYKYELLGSTSSIATAVNSKIIKKMCILKPPFEVIKKFHSVVNPLFERIRANIEENDRLSTLRDTLLPKLMSGEIKV